MGASFPAQGPFWKPVTLRLNSVATEHALLGLGPRRCPVQVLESRVDQDGA